MLIPTAWVEEEIEKMCGSLDYHTDKIEYLENQRWRSNIRLDGIREEGAETWDNTETKVKELLKEKLNLDKEPDVERARQKSKMLQLAPKTSKDHRLRDWKQKEKIIRGARRIKPLEFLLMKTWHKKPLTRGKSSVPSLKKREETGK